VVGGVKKWGTGDLGFELHPGRPIPHLHRAFGLLSVVGEFPLLRASTPLGPNGVTERNFACQSQLPPRDGSAVTHGMT